MKQCRRGSSSPSSSRGSFDALDDIAEDLNQTQESRATGFLGKNSDAAWMRSLASEADKVYGETPSRGLAERRRGDSSPLEKIHNHTIASQSYHDDQGEIFSSGSVHPYALPPKYVADKFYDKYLESVNASFPVIRESLFTQQYQKVFADKHVRPARKWLAILNMIFAIGSRYCSLTGQDIPGSFDDKEFFGRATALGIGDDVLYSHADLQQVQLETLIAFYFLASSQINRQVSILFHLKGDE